MRKLSRIVSFAILAGAAAFAAVVASMIGDGARAAEPTDEPLYMPAVYSAFGLVLVATLIGVRMHGLQGTTAERARKTLIAHVVSLGLCEAAAMFGLVIVLVARSWDPILPAALGLVGLATVVIRGELRFHGLVEAAEGG